MMKGCHHIIGRDKSGDIVQSTIYYPYGEPTIEPKGQRFLFAGKEREHAAGHNSYDFGARNLAANAWTTPDPLAEKFYHISPYSYCGGDPINFIDPDGMMRYYLGMDGRIISREEAIRLQNIGLYAEELNDNDQIVILANDGTAIDVSKMYDANTIIGVVENTTIDADAQTAIPFVSFIIRGDNSATELFEFLSDNITGINNIEYSHFMLGKKGEQGLNYVTTSHKYAGECGGTFLFESQFKYGYTIRNFIHSHKYSLDPGPKDNIFKDMMLRRYKIFTPKADPIIFKIYLANSQYEKERYRIY